MAVMSSLFFGELEKLTGAGSWGCDVLSCCAILRIFALFGTFWDFLGFFGCTNLGFFSVLFVDQFVNR